MSQQSRWFSRGVFTCCWSALLIMLVYGCAVMTPLSSKVYSNVNIINNTITGQDLPPGYFMNIPPEIEDVLWVRGDGDYFKRLSIYNRVLSKLRHTIKQRAVPSDWLSVSSTVEPIWNVDTFKYLNKSSRYPTVTTLALALDRSHVTGSIWHSDNDTSNLVIQKYYQWTASEPLCTWLMSKDEIPHYAWGALFRKRCHFHIWIKV